MALQPGVLESAWNLCERGARAVALPEQSFGSGFWARCKEVERACYTNDPSTRAARFFERRVAIDVGLYDEEFDRSRGLGLVDARSRR